jgi:uncharacterized membrane protein (UPF0136 family)
MAQSRPSAAGGFLIAVASIVGTLVGYHYDQATPGFLIGFGTGVVLSIAVWLLDRR